MVGCQTQTTDVKDAATVQTTVIAMVQEGGILHIILAIQPLASTDAEVEVGIVDQGVLHHVIIVEMIHVKDITMQPIAMVEWGAIIEVDLAAAVLVAVVIGEGNLETVIGREIEIVKGEKMDE